MSSNETLGRKIILHDYLQVNGGAERLVVTLARGLRDYKLCVSGIFPTFMVKNGFGEVPLIELFKPLTFLPRTLRALLVFRILKIKHNVDVVIYSGIYALLAVESQSRGIKIFYCHTPPRFAFDLNEQYLSSYCLPMRIILKKAILLYKNLYIRSLASMDQILANSIHTQKRLFEFTGYLSKVVYPPVNMDNFKWIGQGDYYLSIARHEKKKNIDRIIKAFMKMPDKKLIITSCGSEYIFLQALAYPAKNIFFTGCVNDDKLTRLIGNSIACIYIPDDEDFGMSAIEALAAGKPVIGVNGGGIKESVVHNKTGILLPGVDHVSEIIDAIGYLSAGTCAEMREDCEQSAKNFTEEKFLQEFLKILSLGVLKKDPI